MKGELDSVSRKDSSYFDGIQENDEWNLLHFSSPLGPKPDKINSSTAMQFHHFITFFAVEKNLSHPVSNSLVVEDVVRRLRDALDKMANSGLWLKVQWALRARCTFRRRTRAHWTQARALRDRQLHSWLHYWRECEARQQQSSRGKLRCGAPTSVRERERALHDAVTITPEETKAEVLWSLHWILRLQHAHRLTQYWMKWFALLALRKNLRTHLDTSNGQPFNEGVPQTVAATNAALFVLALQEPQSTVRAGADIRFKDLVRFANAPNIFDDAFRAKNPTLRFTSPIIAEFIKSSLCTAPTWLERRSTKPGGLVPPRTWHPAPTELPRSDSRSPPPALRTSMLSTSTVLRSSTAINGV